MSLPQIVTPEFYTNLPSTKEKIAFRPFLVKEEKILLMAQEGKDRQEIQRAIVRILQACIKTPLDVDTLPLFDVEWLFLQLRAKSVGEVVELNVRHVEDKSCNHLNEIQLSLEDIKIEVPEKQNNIIMIDDNVGITMKYPSLSLVSNIDFENEKLSNTFELITNSVYNVFDKEKVYNDFTKPEIDKFIEDLDQKHLIKFMDFFKSLPKLKHDLKYTCSKCGKEVTHKLEGLVDFFL